MACKIKRRKFIAKQNTHSPYESVGLGKFQEKKNTNNHLKLVALRHR